jgi:glycosyltransferase involved in cell wall biosynthesis
MTKMPLNSIPKVSVIVCTYNGSSKIENCLKSLVDQSFKDKYEIIVVNDGSIDGTKEIIERNKKILLINNQHNLGLAASRNVGTQDARADILVYTDDDCRAEKDWLQNILDAFDDKNVDGVGGMIVPFKTDHWLLRYYNLNNPLAHLGIEVKKSNSLFYRLTLYIARSLRLNRLPSDNTILYSIVGANMSMRVSVYNKLGGFNPDFKFGGEEEEFWSRYFDLQTGHKLLYEPHAIIKHDYEASYKDALRRNYKYGIGNARQSIINHTRPIIYPFPILLLIVFILLVVLTPKFLWYWVALNILAYPGWLAIAIRKKSPGLLLYSFIQLSLEMTTSYGVISGLIRSRIGQKI